MIEERGRDCSSVPVGMECGQPGVGGNVATQLTLQLWFGKGAVLSLEAVPGYDFMFKKEERRCR